MFLLVNAGLHEYNFIPFCFSFSASAAQKKLIVSDETEQTMKVTWMPAPGKVSHYRLKYVPSGGGKEVVLKVPEVTATSTVLRRLQPMTTYNITVNPIYKRREGKARQGVGTTRTLVHNSTLCQDSTLQKHVHLNQDEVFLMKNKKHLLLFVERSVSQTGC